MIYQHWISKEKSEDDIDFEMLEESSDDLNLKQSNSILIQFSFSSRTVILTQECQYTLGQNVDVVEKT